MKLYKNKYMICIYGPLSEGEPLIGLCCTAHEFAKLLGIRYDNATQILWLLFNKKTAGIRFCNKICTVAFVEDRD